MWTIDFETEDIKPAPLYPPEPVGVALKYNNRAPKYYAWAHRGGGNNCTKSEARAALKKAWDSKERLLFHNSSFDVEVAVKKMRMPMLPWNRYHDTLFLCFLYDPDSPSLGLKEFMVRHFDVPAPEQADLKEWVLENVPEATKKTWGGYIYMAPVSLAAPYAKDDVNKTYSLFQTLYPYVKQEGMAEAYDNERRCMPHVMEMERGGVHIDYWRCHEDAMKFADEYPKLQRSIRKYMPDIENINSGPQLIEALDKYDLVDGWEYTKPKKDGTGGGNKSTQRLHLKMHVRNKNLNALLERWSILSHAMANFYNPWLDRMEDYNEHKLYPRFNQVRGRDQSSGGTRHGRFSSVDPNFQQLNRKPTHDNLPFLRQYVLPDRGQILLGRDWSQQELRILAHNEKGRMRDAYLHDPRIDFHATTGNTIESLSGFTIARSPVKITGFTIIYGGGGPRVANSINAAALAEVNNVEQVELFTPQQGRHMKQLWLKANPDVQKLIKRVQEDRHIRTLDHRYITAPGDKLYVLLNRLIQGSAADHAKRTLPVLCDMASSYGGRVLLTVHDEFLLTVPRAHKRNAMADFTEIMNRDHFDVPMLSDGKVGPNWGAMEKYEVRK